MSPTSPTSPLHGWDPMKEDFLSSKNTYAVNPDDLDIAFQGYRMYERKEREAPFLVWRVKSSTLTVFVWSRNTSSQDRLERSVAWRDETALPTQRFSQNSFREKRCVTNPGTAVWRTMSVGNMGPGLVQSLEFLKSLQICPSKFQTWKKSLNSLEVPVFSKVSIDHLFVNPESGKI